uniref:Uncharacterized protein n=1 Tax=Odontella aurita TaxID=265563 RepID=A0A7S4HKP9_9STRA|mmetsp:Transcript_11536/g.33984  ORF Transcript_11536/g.33984 Transcript_11536/m.33984 type:complete len:140 (+) Transcript_11536:6464-6883(+)
MMRHAVAVECMLTERGRMKGSMIKHKAVRNNQGVMTNIWVASPVNGVEINVAAQRSQFHTLWNPTGSYWYSNFTFSVSNHMGNVTNQDSLYSVDLLHTLLRMYKDQWNRKDGNISQEEILTEMFLMAQCLKGMCGYQTV